jgi:hypothetical protein
MSKAEKLVQKALNGPASMRFEDLCALAKAYGFEHQHTTGSHHIYKHPEFNGVMNFQRRQDGKAIAYQVKQLLNALRDLGEIS